MVASFDPLPFSVPYSQCVSKHGGFFLSILQALLIYSMNI